MRDRLSSNKLNGSRATAVAALTDVETRGAYGQVALDRVLAATKLEGRDRGLATELTYGVLRRLKTLDWIIRQFTGRDTDKLDPWVRNAIRVGLFQLRYLDRIPANAACDESVEAVKARVPRAAGLVNAILRRYLREAQSLAWPDPTTSPVEYLAVTQSHPEWIVGRWLDRLGFSEAEQLLETNNFDPRLTVRVNTLRITRSELRDRLVESGLTVAATRYAPHGLAIEGGQGGVALKAVEDGLAQVQDESSMLVGLLVDPKPGERVLDTCSAPGGKATHLAELMQNEGEVVSCDVFPDKLLTVAANCRRLGIKMVTTESRDARKLAEDPAMVSRFDRVLVDAPCSGLGVLARRADARWRKEEKDIPLLAEVQREILAAAAVCVRPGGRLVYSTCTTEPEEDEQNVEHFISLHPEYRLLPAQELLAKSGVEGAADLCSGPYLRVWPHRHQMDGFFAAVVEV